MFLKVLRAERRDLLQADEDELLVPNPMVIPGQDNDFFIGIRSRRPARYGRVAATETLDARAVIEEDLAAVFGTDSDADDDEDRKEDIQYLLETLLDFDPGDLVGCRYQFEGDEITWEVYLEED